MPVALRHTFTYTVPADLVHEVRLGHRVRIPFGRRTIHGYIVDFPHEAPDRKLRAIQAIDPPEVLLTPEILRLTRWVSDYYLAPWGQVLDAALAPPVRKSPGRRARRGPSPEEGAGPASSSGPSPAAGAAAGLAPGSSGFALAPPGDSAGGGRRLTLVPEQQSAYAAIRQAVDRGSYGAFLLFGVTGSGKTEVYLRVAEDVVREGGSVLFLVPEIALGAQILDRIAERFAGQVGLYHSQTGEAQRLDVWRRARAGQLPVVVGTRSAVFVPLPRLRLIVVDEEQEGAYKQEETPRYHSRDVAIVRARQAGAVIVLGSATPALESLYNAEQGKYELLRLPARIHQKDPARVSLVDLLQAAAPEAEGFDGSPGGTRGSSRTTRLDGGPRPRGRAASRASVPILSTSLVRAVEERLARGEQTILFLNRRGYSPAVQCAACGTPLSCRHCDVVMTWHKLEDILRCHFCNQTEEVTLKCPECQGRQWFYGGLGTQKVEEILAETFPGARIARMDLDSTRGRGAHVKLIRRMEAGEIDILLGTQMVAKGFHFPRVTLVGVIQADRELLQPDFRSGERAFRILTQVAGRSGREELSGEVLFQSMMPGHPVITAAADQDYFGFARRELESRQAWRYPPFTRLIDLLVDGVKEDQVRRRAESLADLLRGASRAPDGADASAKRVSARRASAGDGFAEHASARHAGAGDGFAEHASARHAGAGDAAALDGSAGVTVMGSGRGRLEILGPAPMPHARLKGRYRWHLLLKSVSSEALHRLATQALEATPPRGLSRTRVQVDVDPLRLD